MMSGIHKRINATSVRCVRLLQVHNYTQMNKSLNVDVYLNFGKVVDTFIDIILYSDSWQLEDSQISQLTSLASAFQHVIHVQYKST